MRSEAVVALGLAVGSVDSTLYSLEIQPAAVKKRRQFTQRTVFNIVAGVVGVALLAAYAKDQKAAVESASASRRTVARAYAQIQDVDKQAQDIVAKNLEDRAVVEHLAQQAVPLHGALRVMRAVTQNLPPQLWLTKVSVEMRGAGNADKKPVVEIKGRGKELDGANVSNVLLEFSQQLKKNPLLTEAGATPQLTLPSTGDSTVEFTFTIEFGGKS
jgi:hypothetical protein